MLALLPIFSVLSSLATRAHCAKQTYKPSSWILDEGEYYSVCSKDVHACACLSIGFQVV